MTIPEESEQMFHSKFAVHETPFCMWEWDLPVRNLEVIERIDPTYFRYLADIYRQGFAADEGRQHAALALRTAYLHGLESMFALLFAAIQAPDCVVGWLHKYAVADLRDLIRKMENRQKILSKLQISPMSWRGVSNAVHAFSLENNEKEERIKANFATAWHRFAKDMVDVGIYNEYNSIKHGFRVQSGGFRLSIGAQPGPGIPAPPEMMRSLGGSEFGSTFFIPEKIGERKEHFRARRHARNWAPENLYFGLHLISLSMQNILSFLKLHNGVDAASVQFVWPEDESLFEAPWQRVVNPISVSMDSVVRPEHIVQFEKAQILAAYEIETDVEEESS